MFGPRELKLAMPSKASTAPTVIAPRALPGLPIVWPPPELPAAMAKTTPAAVALSTAMQSGSSGLPPPPRLRFATSTRSLVLPSPFGSTVRSIAARTSDSEPLPLAFRTLNAISDASGATPTSVSELPAAIPATCVPWKWSSIGSLSLLTRS